ncbi:hypothetical protein C8R46DRAFT_1103764 [Mycena filopes]|nr:hypothetical protein C8R46DRAFT_1103764 [Mycena filopes]
MEPVSSILTLATFVKDLIELSLKIHHSIEKVKENRRKIRELTNDVTSILKNLASLIRGREVAFQVPELLSALADLKAELVHVFETCTKISPVEPPAGILRLRRVHVQIKTWVKRDDLESKIALLKEHMNKCFLLFTAFAAARIEHTTARIESTALQIANTGVENQARTRHLEGMMAQLLLQTDFGQNVLNQTAETILSDPSHQTLESRYLCSQTMGLIDSIRKLFAAGTLDWPKILSNSGLHETNEWICLRTMSTTHVLHRILGAVLNIHEGCMINLLDIVDLGKHLDLLGMCSVFIAWESMKISIFQPQSSSSLAALKEFIITLSYISIGYRRTGQHHLALKASQQSFDLLRHFHGDVPDSYLRLEVMLPHAKTLLLQTGATTTALSVTKEAALLARRVLREIDESQSGILDLTESDQFLAIRSCEIFVVLSWALSSLDRHLEAYKVWKEFFQVFAQLPSLMSVHSPEGEDIDSFLATVCNLAEQGHLTPTMLADSMHLMQSLALLDFECFGFPFLLLLHGHVYFSQRETTGHPPSFAQMRLFLEPTSKLPAPALDITQRVNFDTCTIVENAISAFYAYPSRTIFPLIQNLLVTHFPHAIGPFQVVMEQVSGWCLGWALGTISAVTPALDGPDRKTLLQTAARMIHIGKFSKVQLGKLRWGNDQALLKQTLWPFLANLWRIGQLDDALAGMNQVITFVPSCGSDVNVAQELSFWQVNQAFILCDMGRFADAVEVIQMETAPTRPKYYSYISIGRARILKHVKRDQEALQTLEKAIAVETRVDPAVTDRFLLSFLLAEVAAIRERIGQGINAVQDAERAVAICREETSDYVPLVHSLTTLSNCLATVGKDDKAAMVAGEAVSIYVQKLSDKLSDYLYPIRKPEVGANAFHSLSICLAISGDKHEALINAEKSVDLYRELVGLAPGHLPALSTSLRNLSSLLHEASRGEESILFCDEAVGIMRKVVDAESYLIPELVEALEQLVGYLEELGFTYRAAAAKAECADARRRFAGLPPQPEFLFEELHIQEGDDDGTEEGGEADENEESGEDEQEENWETASEGEGNSESAADDA